MSFAASETTAATRAALKEHFASIAKAAPSSAEAISDDDVSDMVDFFSGLSDYLEDSQTQCSGLLDKLVECRNAYPLSHGQRCAAVSHKALVCIES